MENKKNQKISLFGNFGTLNLGNECTLEAMIYNIRAHNPKASINSICSNPGDVSIRHKIDASPIFYQPFDKYMPESLSGKSNLIFRVLRLLLIRIPSEFTEWIRAIKVLKDRHVLIMTGTGMLADHGAGPHGFPYQIFKWTVVAKICKVRVYFVSVGAESIHHSLSKLFIKTSIRIADYISFRDKHSEQYMKNLGLNVECKIYPDLAFSLPRTVMPVRKSEKSEIISIGVGLYDYCRGKNDKKNIDQKYIDYMDKITIFISWLIQKGYAVRILIGDIKYDNPVREDLKVRLNNIRKCFENCEIVDNPINSVKQLLEQIEATDLVVATRFHNVLLAIILNIPVISIGYDAKNNVLMESFGFGRYCQDIDNFNVDLLANQFEELRKYDDKYKHGSKEKIIENRNLLDEQYNLILAN